MERENKSSDIFSTEMPLDTMARQHIRSIASWGMVIVVTTVIGYVLSIVELFREQPAPALKRSEGFDLDLADKLGASSMFSSLLVIAIGLLVNYFLFRFATQTRAGLDGFDQEKLNAGFRNLKSYFMAFTIVLIIVFVCVLLLGTVGIAGMMMG